MSAPPEASGLGETRERTLCNCKNVSYRAVCAGVAEGLNLEQLKQQLGCGSQCGSCVPEIKRLLAASVHPVAAPV